EQNEQLRSINDTKIRSTLFVYFVTHLPQPLAIFFFKDPATTQIYTLSLHDALPISVEPGWGTPSQPGAKGLPGEITLSGATVPPHPGETPSATRTTPPRTLTRRCIASPPSSLESGAGLWGLRDQPPRIMGDRSGVRRFGSSRTGRRCRGRAPSGARSPSGGRRGSSRRHGRGPPGSRPAPGASCP